MQPDQRMTDVLAGVIGFAPPAFVGLAGVTNDAPITVAIRSSASTLIVPRDGDESAAIDALRPARLEWTDGLVPVGGSAAWNSMTRFWVARIVSLDGAEFLGTLTFAPLGHSIDAASAVISAVTGAPAVVVSAAGDEPELAKARGRALGHAVVASLDALPPAATELYLDRVVESGAPLAVWRPRPASAAPTSDVEVTSSRWQIGPAEIHFDAEGNLKDVTLPSNPYAG
jgi:hypothetical protein